MTAYDAKQYLRQRFRAYGMTQCQVAENVLHMDAALLSRYMSARLRWPFEAIVTLVHYFDIPRQDVLAVFIEPHTRI